MLILILSTLLFSATPIICMEKVVTAEEVSANLQKGGHQVRYNPDSLKALSALALCHQSCPETEEFALPKEVLALLWKPFLRAHAVTFHKIFDRCGGPQTYPLRSMPKIEADPKGEYVIGSSETRFSIYALGESKQVELFNEEANYIACTCDFTYVLFEKEDKICIFHIPSKTIIETNFTKKAFEQTSEVKANVIEITQNGVVTLHQNCIDLTKTTNNKIEQYLQDLRAANINESSYIVFPFVWRYVNGLELRHLAWASKMSKNQPIETYIDDLAAISPQHRSYDAVLETVMRNFIKQKAQMMCSASTLTSDGRFFLCTGYVGGNSHHQIPKDLAQQLIRLDLAKLESSEAWKCTHIPLRQRFNRLAISADGRFALALAIDNINDYNEALQKLYSLPPDKRSSALEAFKSTKLILCDLETQESSTVRESDPIMFFKFSPSGNSFIVWDGFDTLTRYSLNEIPPTLNYSQLSKILKIRKELTELIGDIALTTNASDNAKSTVIRDLLEYFHSFLERTVL